MSDPRPIAQPDTPRPSPSPRGFFSQLLNSSPNPNAPHNPQLYPPEGNTLLRFYHKAVPAGGAGILIGTPPISGDRWLLHLTARNYGSASRTDPARIRLGLMTNVPSHFNDVTGGEEIFPWAATPDFTPGQLILPKNDMAGSLAIPLGILIRPRDRRLILGMYTSGTLGAMLIEILMSGVI